MHPLRLAFLFAGLSGFVPGSSEAAGPVKLPITNMAGYPFICYVGELKSADKTVPFKGKVREVQYGFTTASAEEFSRDPASLVWLDGNGDPGMAGTIEADHNHDGGYKGSYILKSMAVDVPAGMNLVYRMTVDAWSERDCYGAPRESVEVKASDVFFVEAAR